EDVSAFLSSPEHDQPTPFQREFRDGWKKREAKKIGKPVEIFFLRPDDAVAWSIVNASFILTRVNYAGVAFYIQDDQKTAPLIVIKNNLPDGASLFAGAHEIAHTRQSQEAHELYKSALFRSIVEGYQSWQEVEIILAWAKSRSQFGRF